MSYRIVPDRLVFDSIGSTRYYCLPMTLEKENTLPNLSQILINQGFWTGTIMSGDMPLLAQQEVSVGSEGVRVKIEGTYTRGLPSLRVALDGEMTLPCQRCLDTMTIHIHLRLTGVCVAPDKEVPIVPNGVEVWSVDISTLTIEELVTEILILEIPISPRHEHECSEVRLSSKTVSASPDSPFAILLDKKLD